MTNADDVLDPQVQTLEQMKNEFLAAQQRRRERAPEPAPRHDNTGNEPSLAGPVTESQVAAQPSN